MESCRPFRKLGKTVGPSLAAILNYWPKAAIWDVRRIELPTFPIIGWSLRSGTGELGRFVLLSAGFFSKIHCVKAVACNSRCRVTCGFSLVDDKVTGS